VADVRLDVIRAFDVRLSTDGVDVHVGVPAPPLTRTCPDVPAADRASALAVE